MQRDSTKTVTHIPILVPCTAEEKQGEVISSLGFTPVRVFTEKDKERTNPAGSQEFEHFAASVQLLTAISKKDHVAERNAIRRLSELRTSRPKPAGEYSPKFGELLAHHYGLEAGSGKEAIEIFEGRRHPPSIARHPGKILSLEVTEKFLQVRLVLWWTGKRITPALYCNDSKAAPHVYMLTRRWAICPHCGRWFEQDRPNQVYCVPAHREAHRMARYRQRQLSRKKGKRRTEGKLGVRPKGSGKRNRKEGEK